jgi:hypothetical protein
MHARAYTYFFRKLQKLTFQQLSSKSEKIILNCSPNRQKIRHNLSPKFNQIYQRSSLKSEKVHEALI